MNTPTLLSSDQCKIWWNIANVGGGGIDWLMTSNSMPMCSCSYSRKSWLLSWIDVAGGETLWRMAWTEVLVGILVAPAAASRLPRHQPSCAHPTMLTRHVCQAYHAYYAYTPWLPCLQTCLPCLLCLHTGPTLPINHAYLAYHAYCAYHAYTPGLPYLNTRPPCSLCLSHQWYYQAYQWNGSST